MAKDTATGDWDGPKSIGNEIESSMPTSLIQRLEHVVRLLEESGYELAQLDQTKEAPNLFVFAAAVERLVHRLEASEKAAG